METVGGSENNPPVKEEDAPVTAVPTPEKRELGLISSRRPTPQGQRGGEADDPVARDRVSWDAEKVEEERKEDDWKEDGAFTRTRTEPEGIEGVQVPVTAGLVISNMDEVEDGVTLVAGDIPALVEKGPVAEGSKSLTPEAAAEIAEKFFKCPFCRCLLYKPAVIACGHMLCVGCVQIAMNIVGRSECPICLNRYNHLPRSCELIGSLVLKLQPLEVGTGNTQETDEDEKTLEPTCPDQCSVQVVDVSCVLCQELLYKPTILNCGHVFCISCVPTGGETIECPTCGTFHPSGPLAVCNDLNNFIDDFFPTAHKSRIEKTQSFSGNPTSREIMDHNAKLSHTHVGVGCDFCGVYPIQGDRYSCKTCINFDLCEKCAKMDSPVEGRSGQQHLPDHVLELNDSFLLRTVLGALDKKEGHNKQGTWEWRPSQWLSQVGLMHWHPGWR